VGLSAVQHASAGADPKGWYGGAWNWNLPIALGYANEGIDEPHEHAQLTEIYLVATGTARARVEHRDVALEPGDVLVIEPGEAHTFLRSSEDYRHFVVHVSGMTVEDAGADKRPVPRTRLGL
jgi:mannose-6-phosphate isomerase-like protein (cupin superfamily)